MESSGATRYSAYAPSVLGRRHGHGHDLVADLPYAALAEFVDHARCICIGDVRRLSTSGAEYAGSKCCIRRVDSGRPDADADLPDAGMRIWNVMNTEDIRSSEIDETHCFHNAINSNHT
jgi:hypothetical protein